jgi:serine/threonine-protein kinase
LWRDGASSGGTALVQLDLDVGDEASQLAISADGSQVVFLKGNQLMLRRLDQTRIVPLAGTEDALYPFFAPDGNWIAFFSGGKLRRIAVTRGAPVTICDAQSARGGSWGDDGLIVASLSSTGGLFKVASSGGTPRPLTDLTGESPGVTSHRWPQMLPEACCYGRHRWDLDRFAASPSEERRKGKNSDGKHAVPKSSGSTWYRLFADRL